MAFQSVRISIIAARLSLGVALLFPLFTLADEFVGPPAPTVEEFMGPPAPTLTTEVIHEMDKQRDYVSEGFVSFVSSVDRFFGDDRHYQETNDSVFQLDTTRVMGYGGEHKFVVSGRANVHLPIAEKKLHLLLETDPDKNTVADSKQTLPQAQPANQPATPQSIAAALRFVKEEAERWHLSADAGLKFQGLNTTPFARTRASLAAPMGEWRAKLAESVFWFNTIGAGETTQLDFERTISEPVLLRATSNATWMYDKKYFDLRQDLTVFHKLDERTALLWQASVIGVSRPQAQVSDYVLLMSYRYRLHREWMYFDLSPQLHFPRERDFRTSPMLMMRLEILFDETK
jgi:hypothetical protein